MQPYHTQVAAQVSAQRSHSLAHRLRPHRHHHLPTSSHPTTRPWHTIRLLQLRLSRLPTVKRHHRRQMPMTVRDLGLPLCMISMQRSTATPYKPRLRLSRHQGPTSQDHQRPVRASRARRVHRKARRHSRHRRLPLPQANTTVIPHHPQP
jgi:hypothetical protein